MPPCIRPWRWPDRIPWPRQRHAAAPSDSSCALAPAIPADRRPCRNSGATLPTRRLCARMAMMRIATCRQEWSPLPDGSRLRLVLARLFKLPALVLDFIEQPHVLDRYHCLVGESRYKLYLLRIEWFYDFSAEKNDANRFSLTQERYAKMSTKAAQFWDIVFGIRKDIRDLDWLSLQQNSARHTSAPRRKCEVPNEVRVFRRECKVGRKIESLLFRPHNLRHIGFTQPRSRLC